MSKKFSRVQKYQTLGGRDTLKTTSNRKKIFYFFIVAKIRSDETPSIFNFKKGEIMKHPNLQGLSKTAKKIQDFSRMWQPCI